MKKTDYVIMHDNGKFFRESEFFNEPREDRWVKKIEDALIRTRKKDAEDIICCGYLRDAKAIKVSEALKNITKKHP